MPPRSTGATRTNCAIAIARRCSIARMSCRLTTRAGRTIRGSSWSTWTRPPNPSGKMRRPMRRTMRFSSATTRPKCRAPMVVRRRSVSIPGTRSGRTATARPNSAFCSRLPAWSRRRGSDRRKEANPRLQVLVDEVVRALHPRSAIGGLRAAIVVLDVETKADHGAVSRRELSDVCIHPAIDAAPAVLRVDIDALDPPEVAVSPVAPFLGDHQRADHPAAQLGHAVEAGVGPPQKCAHAGADHPRQQQLLLGLERHRAVEGDERRRIARLRTANFYGRHLAVS